jgi:cell pole-organizing protein PopZ
MRQEGEPSVEEILDSIKKVIARDASETAGSSKPRRREGLVSRNEDTGEEDVLDLGVIGSALRDDDDADAAEEALIEDGPSDEESLTTDRAADAMRQSLAALAMLADPPAKPQIVRQGETSLEGMVREMMRPMLAQWLDANLPDIVERLVKAEIARIAGKKR